jgi:hypothetical protein
MDKAKLGLERNIYSKSLLAIQFHIQNYLLVHMPVRTKNRLADFWQHLAYKKCVNTPPSCGVV